MAQPMADKFRTVATELKTKHGIAIQVQDSWRHPDSQQEQHEKYLANKKSGKNVPFVASSDTSFHTIGYAFDLAQTHEMKKPEVRDALIAAGFIPHENEWWHWSLEKI
jgi:D-alanyl-D-alanine dipeptidase